MNTQPGQVFDENTQPGQISDENTQPDHYLTETLNPIIISQKHSTWSLIHVTASPPNLVNLNGNTQPG